MSRFFTYPRVTPVVRPSAERLVREPIPQRDLVRESLRLCPAGETPPVR